MDTWLTDWNTEVEVDLPKLSQNRPMGASDGLVELLWQDGDLILHNQTHHKPTNDAATSKKLDQSTITLTENPNNLIQISDETISWMHSPVDEHFEKELFANLLLETSTTSNPIEANNIDGLDFLKFGASGDDCFFASQDLAPRFETLDVAQSNIHNLEGTNKTSGILQSSPDETKDKNYAEKLSPLSTGSERETIEQAITSCGSSLLKTRFDHNDASRLKRKINDVEESECQSDATQLDSASGNKSCAKSGTTRKGRVPEVHNRSERRRRDRINEKIRALQEIIPHSNKSGTASILDDAIRYMKSLQMQIQMMWMARMTHPNMQHYTSRLGLSFQNLIGPSRLAFVDQGLTTPNLATFGENFAMSRVNYQNQIQSYLGFPSMHYYSQNQVMTRPGNANG